MPVSYDHIRTTVESYLARQPHERTELDDFMNALNRPTDITSRSTFTGHVTCGAVVVDSLGRVLHVLHLASGKVFAPGGHTKPDDGSLASAALRELLDILPALKGGDSRLAAGGDRLGLRVGSPFNGPCPAWDFHPRTDQPSRGV